MLANRMNIGDTIGIFTPSHVGDLNRYSIIFDTIKRLGFKVKISDNFQKDTYGYAASAEERAADLNAFVADEGIKLILFSGGEGAVEILPLIDYSHISRNPKLFSSYSDGTSILNAIHSQTGLITYYGFGAGQFSDLRYYDYAQFCSHFLVNNEIKVFNSNSEWKILKSGKCEGKLIGGYNSLFALMLANKYFNYDKKEKYILFLEDHEKFNNVAAVSTYLTFIEQSIFINNVTGLIFGHFSQSVPDALLQRLERFGKKNNIPVVYTDDFGHGTNHAILPIGVNVKLDTNACLLEFL